MNAPSDLMASLRSDLVAEHEALDERIAELDLGQWSTATPAEGWDVTDTISHLAYFDHTAAVALRDPEAFAVLREDLDLEGGVRPDVDLGREIGPEAVLARWRANRADLVEAATSADPKARVPWYGPAMSAVSFVTARLMETWAHGQDVADTFWLPPVISPRLRHICHLGVQARPYAFLVHEVQDPGDPVRVEASRPDGETWTWGPADAEQRLAGPALDLALVFTQRRNRADTAIVAEGPTAELWLSVAQAFAGGRGTGRPPLGLSGAGGDGLAEG